MRIAPTPENLPRQTMRTDYRKDQEKTATEDPNLFPPAAVFDEHGLPKIPAPVVGKPLPPNIRRTPTVSGEILNLAPNENPAEKAVEFAIKLATSESENRMLYAQMKKLEADLDAREKALASATAELEQTGAEMVKSRAELSILRKEASALRMQMRQLEREDIEDLRSIIAALNKLLEPAR